MKTSNLFILALLVSTLLLSLAGCSGPSTSSTMMGNQDNNNNTGGMDEDTSKTDEEREGAPDFTLKSVDGVEYTLSEQSGKVVYLFFFGSNCPHCRSNGPVTQTKIYEAFQNDPNFVALGLDTWNTSANEVESFKEVTGITYTCLLNARQSLINYYGDASSYDRSVVVDANGKIAYRGTGFVNTDADKVHDVIQTELSDLGN